MWNLGLLPFVYAPRDSPDNGELPDMLPFALDVDKRYGHMVQSYDPAVEAALDRAYAKGSMLSGMMDETGIGREYAEDFLAFLHHQCGSSFEGRSVLDIGCGTGYFLSRLRGEGAQVLGIEPGAHGQDGAGRFAVPVVRDYFPTAKIPQSFDLITAFGVLEHLHQFAGFLAAVRRQLRENGVFLLAVPDCEPYLTSGDISFFFHEHWNYFTSRSLAEVLRQVFGVEVQVSRSGFGGCLYAAVHLNRPLRGDTANNNLEHGLQEFATFKAKAQLSMQRFPEFLPTVGGRQETLGIFVPGRAVNLLALNPARPDFAKLRFFDDNPLLQGTFYPGIPVAIESRQALLDNPPDRLLIMSHSFGKVIADSLTASGLVCPIMTWHDIYRA